MKTTIKEIFQAEGYSIPNYQRDYAWKDKNFRDLWEDLEEAIEYNKKGQGHFMGIMVVAKNEDNKKLYDIIDGQQRTTTIFISCMSWQTSKMRKTSKRQENIYTKRGN